MNSENHYQNLKRLYHETQTKLKTMIQRYKRVSRENKKLKNENVALKRKLRKLEGS